MNKEIKTTETVKIDAGSCVTEKDINALKKMKEIESRKKHLKMIKISRGYVMTNNPQLYEHLK